MLRRLLLLPAIIAFCTAAQADVVFVDDSLRVGVRNAPGTAEAPIEVVTTGSKLDVLERERGYLRVRTESGVVGWVNSIYVTGEPPARLQLERMQEERSKLVAELKELRAGGAVALEDNERLSAQISELTRENSELHAKLSKVYGLMGNRAEDLSWLWQALVFVLLFSGGIWLGVIRERQRVARRLGGLHI